MVSARTKIFISYVIPEDKFFATWLALKLKNYGFDVWVEELNLQPGESFWTKIEKLIREEVIRFLPIISQSYLDKIRRYSGVKSELSLAAIIRKNIPKFIIPLKVEESEYDELPIEIIDVDVIDFSQNWAVGLRALIDSFNEDSIPAKTEHNAIRFWYESIGVQTTVEHREEEYYTNWFPIEIPEKVYLHFPNLVIDQEIYSLPFYARKLDKSILSFAPQDAIQQYTYLLRDSEEISFKDLISSSHYVTRSGYTIDSPRSIGVGLLHKTIENYLIDSDYRYYRMSGRKKQFFLPEEKATKRVSLKKFGRTSRSLAGKAQGVNWKYGVTINYLERSGDFLVVNYHLIFTDDRDQFLDETKQVKYRRSIPSTWYNRDWLDRLLAIMQVFANHEDSIKIQTGGDEIIKISSIPIKVKSPVYYKEPE